MTKKISRLGFGTAQAGGPTLLGGKQIGVGSIDRKEIANAIDYAVDNGINFFDTADIYGKGLSEIILGETLKSKINKVVICTKFGNREISNSETTHDFSSSWLEKAVNSSLKRLGRDYIDILLFHSPPDNYDWSKYDFSTLEKLIDQGKIIRYGVSCHSYIGAERLLEYENITALEVIYNIIDRRIEKKVLKHSRGKQLSIIARVPLCMGYLSDKYLQNRPDFAFNDFRSSLKKEVSDWIVETVRKLEFLKELQGGISSSAIRFCLSNEKITTVIPGMRNISQVKNNIFAERLGALPFEYIEKIKNSTVDIHPNWR